MFRTLLSVEDPIKDSPEEAALAQDVDLNTIRKMVVAPCPAEQGHRLTHQRSCGKPAAGCVHSAGSRSSLQWSRSPAPAWP